MKGFRYTKEQFDGVLEQTESYVRQNPGQAMLYAFVAGYVLHHIPVRGLVGGLVRLSMMAVRPAVLLYGASKLYQAVQED